MRDPGPPPSSTQGSTQGNKTFPFQWINWFFNFYQWVKENVLKDFMLEIASGRLTGYASMNKFGRDPALGSGATNAVWDGSTTYTWPTSASITHIWSAVDSATTRAVVVEIKGLDTNWDLKTQTVTTDATNSTTAVALTTPLRRVFRMQVLDASAMDQALRVGPVSKANFQAQISNPYNQTLMAIYTVPANKTAYMTQYYIDCNKVSGGGDPELLGQLWVRDNSNGYAPWIKHVIGTDSDATSHIAHKFKPYFPIPEKTDIWIEATEITGVGGVVADVSAGFDLILEDN